jgi:hypothetical protein
MVIIDPKDPHAAQEQDAAKAAVTGERCRDTAGRESDLRRYLVPSGEYVQSDMRFDEAGLLSAFAANRDLIYATAARVYARGLTI